VYSKLTYIHNCVHCSATDYNKFCVHVFVVDQGVLQNLAPMKKEVGTAIHCLQIFVITNICNLHIYYLCNFITNIFWYMKFSANIWSQFFGKSLFCKIYRKGLTNIWTNLVGLIFYNVVILFTHPCEKIVFSRIGTRTASASQLLVSNQKKKLITLGSSPLDDVRSHFRF
jgi:hypothetical protein